SVLHLPLRLLRPTAPDLLRPVRKILPIEQHERVGRRRLHHIGRGRDPARPGPLHIVDLPLLIGQLGRVVIAADVVPSLRGRLVASSLLLGGRRRGLRGERKRKQGDRQGFHSGISQKSVLPDARPTANRALTLLRSPPSAPLRRRAFPK